MRKAKRELSDKPILRGALYCSPKCGCRCTKADYDRCWRKANALAKKMGRGWEADVWENCGWCYAVRFVDLDGAMPPCIHEQDGIYTAYLYAHISSYASSRSPKKAWQKALDIMDGNIALLQKQRRKIARVQEQAS